MSRTHLSRSLLFAAALAAAPAATAFGAGTLIFSDDFESYADTSAMTSVWAGGPGTLSTTVTGANVNSMNHPGGAINNHTINPTSILPSNTSPIVWQFDFYWDGAGNKRISGGLRNSGGGGILEMGYYNAAVNPVTSGTASGFAYRTVNLPGSTGWLIFMNSDNTAPLNIFPYGNTWSTFQAIIKGSSIDFRVDINRDGVWDATATVNGSAAAINYNDVRFGGPSGISSGGGGADFDNLLIRSLASGDANMNGKIDPDDYALLDRGLAMGLTGWSNGDFNNDGVVNADDYLLIDTSFLDQGSYAPSLLSSREAQFGPEYVTQLLAAVPEPTGLGLAAAGAMGLLARRRQDRTRPTGM